MPYRFEDDLQEEYSKLNRRIGGNVKHARLDMGWTQEELSRRLGRSPGWMSFIESGQNGLNMLDLVRIANYTERPIEYFFSGTFLERGWKAPEERSDWHAIFPSDPSRAEMHANIDEMIKKGLAGPTPSQVK